MPLKRRILRVIFKEGEQVTTLTEDLDLQVNVHKFVLAQQSTANITVGGLSKALREQLLSKFTAYKRRQQSDGTIPRDSYIDVSIQAGYSLGGVEDISEIFEGQVALTAPAGNPPNLSVKITAYTNQWDKTQFNSVTPAETMTFKQYCEWGAKQLGLQLVFKSTKGDTSAQNLGRNIINNGAFIYDIQSQFRPDVVAYVDNKTLYVLDAGTAANPNDILVLRQFVGVPTYQEWGVQFTTMFDSQIALSKSVKLISEINPAVNDFNLIIGMIEYDLHSRAAAFLCKCSAGLLGEAAQ